MQKMIPVFLILTAMMMTAPLRAEEAKTEAAKSPPPAATGAPAPQGGASMISANGFSCSMMEGKTQCQGKFAEVDKNLVFAARGSGDLVLRVIKGDERYTYSSGNGCLCEEEKKEIECVNAQGKKQEFKGDKMQQESAAFCSLKK
ncbi:MAG TPA: hypothetical protein VFW62_03365 [bacterium]|nr:hypothetical protein [bacterium]